LILGLEGVSPLLGDSIALRFMANQHTAVGTCGRGSCLSHGSQEAHPFCGIPRMI
jgi:uncharacterized low-complexity protein